jgi:hypothetical protein
MRWFVGLIALAVGLSFAQGSAEAQLRPSQGGKGMQGKGGGMPQGGMGSQQGGKGMQGMGGAGCNMMGQSQAQGTLTGGQTQTGIGSATTAQGQFGMSLRTASPFGGQTPTGFSTGSNVQVQSGTGLRNGMSNTTLSPQQAMQASYMMLSTLVGQLQKSKINTTATQALQQDLLQMQQAAAAKSSSLAQKTTQVLQALQQAVTDLQTLAGDTTLSTQAQVALTNALQQLQQLNQVAQQASTGTGGQ